MANEKIITLDNLATFKDKCDEIYAVPDGNYQTMTVGAADSLTPYGENSGAEDNTPFVFQSTGGSSDVGSKAYLRELRGNSVAFKQPVKHDDYSETKNGITFTNNGDGSWTVSGTATADTTKIIAGVGNEFVTMGVVGHYVMIKGNPSTASSTTYGLGSGTHLGFYQDGKYLISSNNFLTIVVKNGTAISTPVVFRPQLFDLTQLGKDYDTVLAFNRDYPKPYYPYNAGTLLSCKVNGIKNVGYNAFDGELRIGGIDGTTGEYTPHTSSSYFSSSNYIKVIPGETYTLSVHDYAGINRVYVHEYDENKNYLGRQWYGSDNRSFTLKNNTLYIMIELSNNDVVVSSVPSMHVAFHLTWDGSRTGYEEHKEWQYALPNIELRSAGSAYDVAYSVGGGKRRIGVVNLGTLTWERRVSGSDVYYIAPLDDYKYVSTIQMFCDKYLFAGTISASSAAFNISNKTIVCYHADVVYHYIYVKDNSLGENDTPTGVLNYELATEIDITTEENPGWQNPQDIDDFGTQEFLYDNDIDVQVPQGNDFFYPVDYKAFIDSLGGREDIEYNASEIVSHTELSASEDDRDKVDNLLLENLIGTLRHMISGVDFNNTAWVDLGTLTWTKTTNNRFSTTIGAKVPTSGSVSANIICTKYQTYPADTLRDTTAIGISFNTASLLHIQVSSSDYNNMTGDQFKVAVKGIPVVYEKA